ncbi:hypothetical protein KP509_08G020500 [Ceratopteris richardii]|uniref:BHLH domain-containing protein n=1 Tax=Ceratopteris richardii TaxID=49495 RepID=A0A8T2UEN7_CERRI|nr:hypothetical protein KP509_08G020500 [Ceratopteris richardii]
MAPGGRCTSTMAQGASSVMLSSLWRNSSLQSRHIGTDTETTSGAEEVTYSLSEDQAMTYHLPELTECTPSYSAFSPSAGSDPSSQSSGHQHDSKNIKMCSQSPTAIISTDMEDSRLMNGVQNIFHSPAPDSSKGFLLQDCIKAFQQGNLYLDPAKWNSNGSLEVFKPSAIAEHSSSLHEMHYDSQDIDKLTQLSKDAHVSQGNVANHKGQQRVKFEHCNGGMNRSIATENVAVRVAHPMINKVWSSWTVSNQLSDLVVNRDVANDVALSGASYCQRSSGDAEKRNCGSINQLPINIADRFRANNFAALNQSQVVPTEGNFRFAGGCSTNLCFGQNSDMVQTGEGNYGADQRQLLHMSGMHNAALMVARPGEQPPAGTIMAGEGSARVHAVARCQRGATAVTQHRRRPADSLHVPRSVAAPRPKKGSRHPLGPALNTNLKPRAQQGSANDPQSIAARQRRERINARLKTLQELVPNGSKVDLVTMLEKAIHYVKFLQLQLKVLADDQFWRNPQNITTNEMSSFLDNIKTTEMQPPVESSAIVSKSV